MFAQQNDTNPQNLRKKNKGKGNKGNQGNQGNQPSEPQGNEPNTNNQQQGSQPMQNKAIHMNKPCACCGVHGHYTHECPLLPQMRQLWEAKASSRGQQSPQDPVLLQLAMLTNPFP